MHRLRTYRQLAILVFLSAAASAVSQNESGVLYPAHAHNDYLHERPLLDALDHQFRSIEADVFARGDSLYVAHNQRDIRPGRTLRELYLTPLMKVLSGEGHLLCDSACPLILLIDIKDDGLSTYQVLDRILQDYREILCRAGQAAFVEERVMVVVSGNRPIEYMGQQTDRLAFVDGRMEDLKKGYSPLLMPLISDRWTKYFSWKGRGTMPEKEREQLREYVREAHENGQLVRFWATPDAPGRERDAVWTELLKAGADLINTDDLTGLRTFIRKDPKP